MLSHIPNKTSLKHSKLFYSITHVGCNYAGNSTLSSLALDSSHELLYFTDPGSDTLHVRSTEGFGSSNLLIAGANEKPRAIAVDSTNRHVCSLKYVLCISQPEATMLTLWRNLEALMTRSGQGHYRMNCLVFKRSVIKDAINTVAHSIQCRTASFS